MTPRRLERIRQARVLAGRLSELAAQARVDLKILEDHRPDDLESLVHLMNLSNQAGEIGHVLRDRLWQAILEK